MATKNTAIHQMTIADFDKAFPDEDACSAYLVERRWPRGVRCPRCGNEKVYQLETRKWHWQCHQCARKGYRFSHIVGTIFENTNVPLRTWFRIIHRMMTSQKGVSPLQIQRIAGFGTYRTASSIYRKIRAGLNKAEFLKLVGIVEVGETLIGGNAKNRHKDKRGGRHGIGKTGSGKTTTGVAVQRKGTRIGRVL